MSQSQHAGESLPAGNVGVRIITPLKPRASVIALGEIKDFGFPRRGLPNEVNAWRRENFEHLWRGVKPVIEQKIMRHASHFGMLFNARIRPLAPDRLLKELGEEWGAGAWRFKTFPRWLAEKGFRSERLDFGLASLRVVTTAGVNYLVDSFQNAVEPEAMKYHGTGTGVGVEAIADTALGAECTTALNPDNTRATGTTAEGATANIYRTVGTNTYDAAAAITEHGIFSQAATGGGVLLDRSLFAAINVASGDSLQSTYDLTFTAGG